MRLLNTTTLNLVQFTRDIPTYAILSHTWGDQEVSFQDIELPERDKKKGFVKILGCCAQAVEDSIEWVWIDTCCIDKTSSAELSEAINSMFLWYHRAEVCYVYLEDVTFASPLLGPAFRSARWFTRGWCLQELIAPHAVEFYSADWREIGTKLSLCGIIQQITAIPRGVLLGEVGALQACNVAQKMSWASGRQTTRIEDEAYSLLGIFGINMPMLYGEGGRAFHRLQEEIVRQSEDASLFLWTWDELRLLQHRKFTTGSTQRFVVFASRPRDFFQKDPLDQRRHMLDYGAFRRYIPGTLLQPHSLIPHQPSSKPALSWSWGPWEMTSRGLHVFLPCAGVESEADEDESTLLMWTGFLYKDNLVCVRLVYSKQGIADGDTRFFRTINDRGELSLVKIDDAANFKVRDIYLATVTAVRSARLEHISADNLEQIDVALSSSSAATLSLSAPESDFTSSIQPTNTCHTVILRIESKKPLAVSPITPSIVSLRLFVSDRLSAENTPPQEIRIALDLNPTPGHSTCALNLVKDGHSPATDTELPGTDRAQLNLPNGHAIRASVKVKPYLHWFSRFILRVEVLPFGLRNPPLT
ncbi:hypothetical protein NEMBOFW57_010903 [Staphylotrichum longicolle]|uniref:Heterokaryon incompatibility domain-containing protein n=1 Tax=Staphylotrichum longicolle TaxID=669026 RepID=A0AAD4ESG6_9PEZI|nr:hypothetical protein NEMBOFW57_010903 [Staphylotrichum longicolle]